MFEIDLCDIYRARNPDSRRGEHGEKSSRYLLNLEKRNKAKSHVRTLISESGIQVNDPTEIMSKVRDFFRNSTLNEARKLRRNVWIT